MYSNSIFGQIILAFLQSIQIRFYNNINVDMKCKKKEIISDRNTGR